MPAKISTGVNSPPLGLYIHWPFCLSKCPYCDFNSHVAASPVDQEAWLAGLKCEMRALARRIPEAHLTSIFFGGGTPSLMLPRTVAGLIEAATGIWHPSEQVEVTLEANPTSAEKHKFHDFALAGVNRLSIGIQALDDMALKRLGRRHSASEAMAALELAGKIFERVSFDLIYARQEQQLEDWQSELRRAVSLAAGHLSLYQLSIEPGTPFHAAYRQGGMKIPGEECARDFYDVTQEICEQAGLPAYEISNHAAPGHESRHNLVYWRGGDYLGIGPGAHSRLQGRALANESNPKKWLAQVTKTGHGLITDTPLSPLERAEEMLMMGARLREGVDLRLLAARTGYYLPAEKIAELEDDGLIEIISPAGSSQRLAATAHGRPVLNAILGILAPALTPIR